MVLVQVVIDPKFKAFIIQLLRRGTYRWPARTEAYREARVARGLYKCASCLGTFKCKEVNVDHIEPVVDVRTGFINWDTYINRMYCPKEGLQVLCQLCHNVKSSVEQEMRKQFRKPKEKKARKKRGIT